MKKWLRRIRGAIGLGLTWALGWAGLFGMVLLIMAGSDLLEGWDLLYTVRALLGTGAAGFIAGSVFGVVLSILEGRRTLEELSLWRIAMWGGLGGLAFAAVLGPQYLGEVIALWLLGVGSASGSVALARRDAEPKLIEGDEEPPLSLEQG